MATDAIAPFLWGSGGSRMTPEDIVQQRKVAQALMQQGMDYSPVASPWQGAARMAQALLGGWESGQADYASKQNNDESNALIAKALASSLGGVPAAGATPAAVPAVAPAVTGIPMASGPVVPNDDNAIPGTVGMSQALADRTQDFIQDNPGAYLSSGVRSPEQQAALYADRANNPNPVAPPGTSRHERGLAADIGGMSPVARALLPQYGLAQPVANDPPHVELAPNVQVASNDPAALPARPAINPAILQMVTSPYASDTAKKIGGALFQNQLEQVTKANDPMRALQMEKLRADIAKAQGKAGTTEYGLNPIYGTDDKGNAVLGTLGKDGTFKQIDTGGVKVSTGVDKVDLGTQFAIYDKKSGNLIGYQPKDLRGAEREKGIGKAQGTAVASAPADIQAGENALDILGKIRTNPYLERGTGFSSIANSIPGTGGHDFANMVEQAKSGAFLQAIQHMRGLGSLSNAEGGAATAAVTRMNTSTSKGAFLDALNDYEKIVKQGMSRAQSRLDNPSATNPAPAASSQKRLKFNPATGMLE